MSLGNINDTEIKIRIAYLSSLHFLYDNKSREILLKLAKDSNKSVIETSLHALRNQRLFCSRRNLKWWGSKLDPPKWLLKMFENDFTRERAVIELYLSSGDLADSLVIRALSDKNPKVVIASLKLITNEYSHLWNEKLMLFADSKESKIREIVADLAQKHLLLSEDAKEKLQQLSKDSGHIIKSKATKALENQKKFLK